jgi:hypothetical protein
LAQLPEDEEVEDMSGEEVATESMRDEEDMNYEEEQRQLQALLEWPEDMEVEDVRGEEMEIEGVRDEEDMRDEEEQQQFQAALERHPSTRTVPDVACLQEFEAAGAHE